MPTIEPLAPSQASPDLKESLDILVRRFGRLPNIFGVMAHRPAVLKHFLPLYAAIMDEGTIAPRHRELAYMKAAIINGCTYCTQAHRPLLKRANLTADHLAALPTYERSPLFDEMDKAVIRYAELVTRAAAIREPDMQALRSFLSPAQIVELTLVVCMANFTSRFSNALQIVPDIG